jgi:chaperonin cofactor prefoldin
MDPVLMAGGWAAALLSVGALGRGLYHLFIKAVKSAIREELSRVWTDQDQIEQRLSALETSLHYIKQQVEALTLMMQQHVQGDRE